LEARAAVCNRHVERHFRMTEGNPARDQSQDPH
jgi:hypothetical protein